MMILTVMSLFVACIVGSFNNSRSLDVISGGSDGSSDGDSDLRRTYFLQDLENMKNVLMEQLNNHHEDYKSHLNQRSNLFMGHLPNEESQHISDQEKIAKDVRFYQIISLLLLIVCCVCCYHYHYHCYYYNLTKNPDTRCLDLVNLVKDDVASM